MKRIIEKGLVSLYSKIEFNEWFSKFIWNYKDILIKEPRIFELVLKDVDYRFGDFKEIHVVKLYLSSTKKPSLVVSRGISINSSIEFRQLRTWMELFWYIYYYSDFSLNKKTVLIELRDAGISNRFYVNMANIIRSYY